MQKSVPTSVTASPGSQTVNTVATNTSLAWAVSQQQQSGEKRYNNASSFMLGSCSETGGAVAEDGGDCSSSSLVLGESVSMYAVNDAMDQHCDNILGQVGNMALSTTVLKRITADEAVIGPAST